MRSIKIVPNHDLIKLSSLKNIITFHRNIFKLWDFEMSNKFWIKLNGIKNEEKKAPKWRKKILLVFYKFFSVMAYFYKIKLK